MLLYTKHCLVYFFFMLLWIKHFILLTHTHIKKCFNQSISLLKHLYSFQDTYNMRPIRVMIQKTKHITWLADPPMPFSNLMHIIRLKKFEFSIHTPGEESIVKMRMKHLGCALFVYIHRVWLKDKVHVPPLKTADLLYILQTCKNENRNILC